MATDEESESKRGKYIMDSSVNGEKSATFDSKLERLKAIVVELEQSNVDLEQGVKLYKEACACVKFCQQKLLTARNELEDENGELKEAEIFLAGLRNDNGDTSE